MKDIKFAQHNVNARTNLLDFVNQHIRGDILEEIAKDPLAWREELSMVKHMLTGTGLCGGTGFHLPPLGDSDMRDLGENTYVYLGSNDQLKGLWVKEESGVEEFEGTAHEWTLYRLGTRAHVFINSDYQDVNPDDLLPENFEEGAEKVEVKGHSTKRPIWKFPVRQGQLEVYAKGSDTALSRFFSPPYYRRTSIAGIHRTTSQKEMETTLDLEGHGINVPNVVGHYKSDFEEFLFLESVAGEHPDECLPKHKEAIIEQDADMLAAMCLAGYRKQGFGDYDDKLFDGDKLWLIDVDECRDLYFPMSPKWRDLLVNPTDTKGLRRFRVEQRNFLRSRLKDTIFDYKEGLLQGEADKVQYARSFFNRMGWREPDQKALERLTTFPRNYQTLDSHMGMMMED